MDDLFIKQSKFMALGIGILLLIITTLLIMYPVNAVSIDEIKSYSPSSSGGTVINNYYSNVYYSNYTIAVQALTSSPARNNTNYFGNKPSALSTIAGQNKIYIRTIGNITKAEIYQYSGTAGTNQPYNLTIVKNGVNQTSKGFIAGLSVATKERIFSNTSICVPVVSGDYIELMFWNPRWTTPPATTITGGYIEVSS